MSVVERLEAAIDRELMNADYSTFKWEADHGGLATIKRAIARAAVAAIRDLPLDIKLAGAAAITREDMKANANYDAFCAAWSAAIDAALAEGETK